MTHLNEEELVLHYYSEGDSRLAVEQHLDVCESCRLVYHSLERTLDRIEETPVPERGPAYEAQVWARLQPALPAGSRFGMFAPPWRWAAAGFAFAALLVAAFLVGRSSQPPVQIAKTPIDTSSRERALLVAVGHHLERSQMVLTELANASPRGALDISFEQERAADLLGENRLYRQSAAGAGDAVMAAVLDELERTLLEIEHAPSRMSPGELSDLRLRLQAEGLLFKLRVLASTVQDREEPVRQPL
ncbi:MAG TPA: hypothetical protein VGF16_07550 [Bryobacteraceae bacterium]|jgi:hypothetical protein